jgi:hypothetical protein
LVQDCFQLPFFDDLDLLRPFLDLLLPFRDLLLLDRLRPFLDLLLRFFDLLLLFLDLLRPFLDLLRPFLDLLRPFLDLLRPFLDLLRPLLDFDLDFVFGLLLCLHPALLETFGFFSATTPAAGLLTSSLLLFTFATMSGSAITGSSAILFLFEF